MPKVLIADVEKNQGHLLKQELGDEGFAVDVILRGETEMPLFNGTTAYDVVLLDMQMPGLNYNERLKRIRAYSASARVVVLADNLAADERKSLLDFGADACFAKDELARLKQYLAGRAGEDV